MRTKRILQDSEIDPRFPETNPWNKSTYRQRILAEGDSWFSFGAIPSSNLLNELNFKQSTVIVNIARSGDTIVGIADPGRRKRLAQLLANKHFTVNWDAILLSGGGNDLIGNAGTIVAMRSSMSGTPKPEDYVNTSALAAVVDKVQRAYGDIVEIRDRPDSPNRGVRVVVHTYDYPTPRDSAARFLGAVAKGPWLYRAMVAKKVPESLWIDVSDRLLNALSNAIVSLTKGPDDGGPSFGPLPAFEVVDTRGALVRAETGTTHSSGDWLNEIHPNTSGYRRIAERVTGQLGL